MCNVFEVLMAQCFKSARQVITKLLNYNANKHRSKSSRLDILQSPNEYQNYESTYIHTFLNSLRSKELYRNGDILKQ